MDVNSASIFQRFSMNKKIYQLPFYIVLLIAVWLSSCSLSQPNKSVSITFDLASARDLLNTSDDTTISYKLELSLFNADTKECLQKITKETGDSSVNIQFTDILPYTNIYVTATCTMYSNGIEVYKYIGISNKTEIINNCNLQLVLTKANSFVCSSEEELLEAIGMLKTVTSGSIILDSDITLTTPIELPKGSSLYLKDGVTLGGYENFSEANTCEALISSANGLTVFAKMVNSGYTTICAKILNDIDMSSVCSETIGSFVTIGTTSDLAYNGTFDGCGHTIENVYISLSSTSGEMFTGFFDYLDTGAIIRNVALSGEITGNGTERLYTGGICGRNNGTIINCQNHCIVSSISSGKVSVFTGGIAGNLNDGLIINCSDDALLYSKSSYGNLSPGGIIGWGTGGAFYNCYWIYHTDMYYGDYYQLDSSKCSHDECFPYKTEKSYFTKSGSANPLTDPIKLYTLAKTASELSVAAADATTPDILLNAWVKNIGNADGNTQYCDWSWNSTTLAFSFANSIE